MTLRDIRFATNRKPFAAGFSAECEAEETRLRLGRARVADAASPLLDGRLAEDGTAVEMSEATEAEQVGWLADWMASARAEGRVPLLYVHGYCYSFADALARAGQIAAFYATGDFAVELAPLAFCWPSSALLGNDDYLSDRARCEGSAGAL